MTSKQQISRRWCFTLNNWKPDHEDTLKTVPCAYLVYGKEKGSSGTPHLQGFIIFEKPKALTACVKIFQAHWTITRKSSQQASDYCKKDGQYVEKGKLPPGAGKRSDLDAFMEVVKDGELDPKTLRATFPDVCAKYPRFVNEFIRDSIPDPPLEVFPLRDWQQDINEMLLHEPDDRTVTFVVDQTGNAGKSWFAKYYCSLHENAFLMRPGKHADMAYAIPPTLRVLFLDCTRKQVEYMPYTFMEELKDGYVSSSKYESCVKKYNKLHVVVFMNQPPDMTALSEDRYHVMELS